MLQLKGVKKTYNGAVALATIDLDVAAGETLVLLGPSGCGKSTLLRIIIGLITPDTGTVLLEGTAARRGNILHLRRRIGYVIQEGGLFPHLTARGNATLMARHLGWSAARCTERLDELAVLTHFPLDGLDRYPAQLSGGQRQRVGLMRALMLDPDLLLLDEPLGALDPMIRAELQADLREIFARLHKTVVMVTHDIGEAGYLGGRIVLLRAGRLVQQGTLAEMVRNPADPFVTQFINAQRSPLDAVREGEL
jgi:osmoprotectant transport system ATP-binding protein